MKAKPSKIQVTLGDPRLAPIPDELLDGLTKKQLIVLLRGEQKIRQVLEETIEVLKEREFELDGSFFKVRRKLFATSSEKSDKDKQSSLSKTQEPKPREKRTGVTRLPSERYPNASIIEEVITAESDLHCKTCQGVLTETDMAEVSEYLDVIPKEIVVVRQRRVKYRCECCHGDIQTAPAPPRLIPGSSYSDELVIDSTLSKYSDLTPMGRYSTSLESQGSANL